MSIFWDGNFYFNNVYSTTYKVCIVDVNNNDILKQHGLTYNIETNRESSVNLNNLAYSETDKTSEVMTIQLCRTDGKPWTTSTVTDVKKWLFTKTFKQFQTDDFKENGYKIVYYLKAIASRNFFTSNMEGYIEVDFISYSPYAYAIPLNNTVVLQNEIKTIYNYSNLEERYRPIMKLTNYGDESTLLTINNTTISGNSLKLQGLKNNQTITIDCLMNLVVDTNNVNKFSLLQNFTFTELQRGNNKIQLIGNGKLEIICQFPIIL